MSSAGTGDGDSEGSSPMHGNPLIKLAVGAVSLVTGSLIGIVAGLLAGSLVSWSVVAAHSYFSDSSLSPTAKQQAEPSRSVDQFVPSDPPKADQPPFSGLVPWTGSHPSGPSDIQRLSRALKAADAAGAEEDARILASALRAQLAQQGASPTQFPGQQPMSEQPGPGDVAEQRASEADQPRFTVEQREAIDRARQRVDERAARVERKQPARSEVVLTIALAIGGMFGVGIAIGVGYRATRRIFRWAYT